MHAPPVQRISELNPELLASLNAESNRGITLVAAALLDEALFALLMKSVLCSRSDDKCRKDVAGKLFGDRGPLQAFSSKIDMTFVTGGVDELTWKALHIVRKIRNDFAHSVCLDFSDQSVQGRIDNLRELLFPTPKPEQEGRPFNWLGQLLHLAAEKEASKGTRDLFDLCIATLHERVVNRVEGCKPKTDFLMSTVYDQLYWGV